MKRRFFEATNEFNWGKFVVVCFDSEWSVKSAIDGNGLLRSRGWGPQHLLVGDVQTGEAAMFAVRSTGVPHVDLEKHQIWVCPMFEPFLEWLYVQDIDALFSGPEDQSVLVELPDAVPSWAGYRRPGPAAGACPTP